MKRLNIAICLIFASVLSFGQTHVLDIPNGGTNGATAQSAFDNLAPSCSSAGCFIYWSGSHYVKLDGNSGSVECLQETSGTPAWGACGGTTVNNIAHTSHRWLDSFAAPNFTSSQPACGDLSDGLSGCNNVAPANTTGTTHQFFTAYNQSTGAFTKGQPSCSDLSDAGSGCSGSTGTTVNNYTAPSHQFVDGFTAPNLTSHRPACADLSDSGPACSASGLLASINADTTSAQVLQCAYPLVLTDLGGGVHRCSCPTCATGPNLNTAGGLLGGLGGNGLGQASLPWSINNSALVGTVNPAGGIYLNNLQIVANGNTSPGGYEDLFFFYTGSTSVSSGTNSLFVAPDVDRGRITIPDNTTNSGTVYTEHSGSPPFYVPQQHNFGLTKLSFTNGFTGITLGPWTAQILGVTDQPLAYSGQIATVSANTTAYVPVAGNGNFANTTEANAGMLIPDSFNATRLCVTTNTSEPSSNSLAITLDLNHAGGGFSPTALTFTLASTAAIGSYCATGTVNLVQNDVVTLKLTETGTSASAQITSVGVDFVPTGSTTAIVPFNCTNCQTAHKTGYLFVTNSSCASPEPGQTTCRSPWPRAQTATYIGCYWASTPASGNGGTITLVDNGSLTSLALTMAGGTGCTNNACFATGSAAISASDGLDTDWNWTGSVGTISLCTLGLQ